MPEEFTPMTQEKWSELTVLDPFVRSLSKNEVGVFLKSKMMDSISLVLVNDAQGFKVGYVTKSKNWSHKGLPQHENPMLGKLFQGNPETHASTGVLQVLMGIPVLENGKPIGTLIFGVKSSAL